MKQVSLIKKSEISNSSAKEYFTRNGYGDNEEIYMITFSEVVVYLPSIRYSPMYIKKVTGAFYDDESMQFLLDIGPYSTDEIKYGFAHFYGTKIGEFRTSFWGNLLNFFKG